MLHCSIDHCIFFCKAFRKRKVQRNRRLHQLTLEPLSPGVVGEMAIFRQPQGNGHSGAPDALLDVGVGDSHGLVVDLGGVLIEGVGGLSAEVAVLEVEVEGADTVRAMDASELNASLDPLGGVRSHGLIVVPAGEGAAHCGRVAKVTAR